jgi:hypothetical protein
VIDKPAIDTATQNAIVYQIRGTLKKYAFIFTAIGCVITALNVFNQMYIRSQHQATLVSRDFGLITAQTLLARNSNGGTDYRVELKKNDDFRVSLIVLMNYYEATAEMVDQWAIFGPLVRSSLTCPLGKHARIFLLGQSKAGYWTTDGAFFSPDQFPRMMSMFKEIETSSEMNCLKSWKG